MKKLFLVIGMALVFVVPSLFACEDCFHAGEYDPVGNYLYAPKCWDGLTKGYATCLPNANSNSCTFTTDSSCTGSGSGVRYKNPVSVVGATECAVDAVGVCSNTPRYRSPFL